MQTQHMPRHPVDQHPATDAARDGGRPGSIEQARRSLRETVAPVSAIGESCGFASLAQFNRCFTEQTGEDPAEYRRRMRREELDFRHGVPFAAHGFGSATDEPTAIFG